MQSQKTIPSANRRRRYMTTPAQDELIRRRSVERNVPACAVFREIVNAGFDVYFGDGGDSNSISASHDAQDSERAMSEEMGNAHAMSMSMLAMSVWSQSAVLGLLRWTLQALGQDVDDPRIPWCAISRCMSTADCNAAIDAFASVGIMLAEGAGFDESLEVAFKNADIPWKSRATAEGGGAVHGHVSSSTHASEGADGGRQSADNGNASDKGHRPPRRSKPKPKKKGAGNAGKREDATR